MGAAKGTTTKRRQFYADPLVIELIHDYFELDQKRPRKQPAGKFGLCYAQTPLGPLEISVDHLLAVTAEALLATEGKRIGDETEITDAVVEASLNILDRIPEYMARDLLGMAMEARVERYAIDLGLPFSQRTLQKRLADPAEELFRMVILKLLFESRGTFSLEMDDIRMAFHSIVSKKGILGKPWRKFLKTELRERKKPGRPRNTDYDLLFNKRTTNPKTETFGRLLRELPSAISVSPDVARNRLKAAAAYRRKKLSLGQVREL
jgi:hypothetical protein